MIKKNENEELSRNRKRRNERRMKLDGKMKSILNTIKTEKKEKNKNLDKVKQLEIELVKLTYAINPNKSQSELKELNEIHSVRKNFHEIKNDSLRKYTGVLELVGNLSIGDHVRETHIRFRNMEDFESFINAIDEGYHSDDSIFNG